MEYRSGVTGGPHPGLDIFPDLSPRAKPYCGVKCSQGLHFPATDCGAWSVGRRDTIPHSRGDTGCLNVSYGLVLAKSLGTSKMVDLGVLIYRS